MLSSTQSSRELVDYSTLLPPHLDRTIQQWLEDDIPSFDVGGLVVGSKIQSAQLFLKSAPCIFAGKPFFERTFALLGCTVQWKENLLEGMKFLSSKEDESSKVLLATVTGPVHALLRGERTALNILSRCSGVATAAAQAVQVARDLGWMGHVSGTRKTTPGFRVVEKYGLLVGGAATHRLDLSQMVMLKDNHIWSTGSISNAVSLARKAAGFSQKIEVECQTLEEAVEAALAGADVSSSCLKIISSFQVAIFFSHLYHVLLYNFLIATDCNVRQFSTGSVKNCCQRNQGKIPAYSY